MITLDRRKEWMASAQVNDKHWDDSMIQLIAAGGSCIGSPLFVPEMHCSEVPISLPFRQLLKLCSRYQRRTFPWRKPPWLATLAICLHSPVDDSTACLLPAYYLGTLSLVFRKPSSGCRPAR